MGPEQIKEYGSLVENEGRRLSGMVDQVLEFAGLQSQGRALAIEVVPIDRVIELALADCDAAIEESGVKVDTEVAPQLTVMADASALRRAIQNLVDNAIKYGGDAKWVGIRAKASSEGRKHEVLITIADKGPGIPAEDLPHLFRVLLSWQEGPGRTSAWKRPRARAGSPNHRGTRRENRRQERQGTRHNFQRPPPRERRVKEIMKFRVLLVEDEPGLVLTLSDRLVNEGYAVAAAGDGEEGLKQATSESFDLVILDVMLPGKSGFDVCRDLRQKGFQKPILMLTARGQVTDKVVGP